MRLPRIVLAGALLLAGSACLPDLSLDPERLGIIEARALDDGGTPVLRVRGTFYVGFGLDALVGGIGTCQVLAYNPAASTDGSGTLDAGPSLTASIGGANELLRRSELDGSIIYEMIEGSTLPYTPGDTLTVTIAGQTGGFPPASIRVRTAEAFVMDPVIPPPDGPAVTTVTWTPPTTAGSVMTLSLRYSSVAGNLTPNSQIFCAFDDDGSATVPDFVRFAWVESDPASRSQFAQRVRQSVVSLSSSTGVRLFSFYGFPTPTAGEL